MKPYLLMIASCLSLSCLPSFAQAVSQTGATATVSVTAPTAQASASAAAAPDVELRGPLPVVTSVKDKSTEVISNEHKRHPMRIGLPGLFHINMP